jgi:hypothetical protein
MCIQRLRALDVEKLQDRTRSQIRELTYLVEQLEMATNQLDTSDTVSVERLRSVWWKLLSVVNLLDLLRERDRQLPLAYPE